MTNLELTAASFCSYILNTFPCILCHIQPAYTNSENDVQIYYALRYPPPPDKLGYFITLYRDDKNKYNQIEPWDDLPVEENGYEDDQDLSNLKIDKKIQVIENDQGKRVIAKLTSRSDIVEAEMSKRKEHNLSRHYVPAIISVHHTIQHSAYSEAMAEPSYCITMESADTTAENLLLDLRRSGGSFAKEHLKSIAISLLHIHDRGKLLCEHFSRVITPALITFTFCLHLQV